MRLVIGCPVKDRDWVLDRWFDHVFAAIPDGWDVSFVFVIPEHDPCIKIIDQRTDSAKVIVTQEENAKYVRDWCLSRYQVMSHLRNLMLMEVRRLAPDLFLSLDSDILLSSDAIVKAYQSMLAFDADAVAVPTFLSQGGTAITNAAHLLNSHSVHRAKLGTQVFCDVLMAIKLMRVSGYHCDYDAHNFGEDFGWSLNAKDMGLKLLFDGTSPASKHVMSPVLLDVVDKRCGF